MCAPLSKWKRGIVQISDEFNATILSRIGVLELEGTRLATTVKFFTLFYE